MNKLSFCKMLVMDIISSNFLFSTSSELVFSVAKYIGDYCMVSALLCMISALFCISSINYILGVICYRYYIKIANNKSLQRYNIAVDICNKYLFIIILLVYTPIFGKMVIFTVGFFRISYVKCIILFIIAKIVYYFSPFF